jgi:hypothetical protein
LKAWITAYMIRSQLARLVKQVMGRVRRRISRKARSIAFVVSDAPPVALRGQVKSQQGFPIAEQAGDGIGGGALPRLDPVLQRPFGGGATAGEVDAVGQAQGGGAVPDAEALGDIAEDMDPARLAGDLRIDERERGVEAGMSIGRNEPQRGADEAATGQGGEEDFPGPVAFLAGQPVVDELPLPLGGEPVSDEREAAFLAVRRLDAQPHGIEQRY